MEVQDWGGFMVIKDYRLIGIPVSAGTGRAGCEKGPDALRAAGIGAAIAAAGHRVVDLGNLVIPSFSNRPHTNCAIKSLAEISSWINVIATTAYGSSRDAIPVFIGGDHSLAAGSLSGIARRAAEKGRELFVLWLDAHPDFHTLHSTTSGNLHGVSLAYASGQSGFDDHFPGLPVAVKSENICMMGLRSVDPAEHRFLQAAGITTHDMSAIRRFGFRALLARFLDRVRSANGLLHVSFDVDFLDPSIAPAVGTTVAGGVTLSEARQCMDILSVSGLVTSLDLVELNPLLDRNHATANLMVELAGRLVRGKQAGNSNLERHCA